MTTDNPPTTPNPWAAALLSLLMAPFGLLYVGRPLLALACLAAIIATALAFFAFSDLSLAASALHWLLTIAVSIYAYQRARTWPKTTPRPRYTRWQGIAPVIAIYVVTVVGLRVFLVEPFRAPSASMAPTVPIGVSLAVHKWGYGNVGAYGVALGHLPPTAHPQRGDIIVFERPADRSVQYLKRVIGVPGDTLTYSNNQIVLNGKAIPTRAGDDYYDDEQRAYTKTRIETLSGNDYTVLIGERFDPPAAPTFPMAERCRVTAEAYACEVPPGHYFVMGDNRDNSQDSRHWGFVPADHLVGKVVFVGR